VAWRRVAPVEAQLRAGPGMRVAFDVVDVPLQAGPRNAVSVVLAIKSGDHVLSGEVRVAREQWDLEGFLATVGPTADRERAS
jgi:hypothetical protein